jgi:hypothetical protein
MRKRVRIIMIVVAATFILGFLAGELWHLIGTKGSSRGRQEYSFVGAVGKHNITFEEYRGAQAYITNKYKQENRLRDLSNEDYAAIEQQTWRYIVNELTWGKVFRDGRIRVTQEELFEIVKSNPPEQLRNDTSLYKDGKFDQEKYLQLVNAPENREFFSKYLQDLAEMLPREKFRIDAASAYRVTNAETQDALTAANTRWRVTSLFFGARLAPQNQEPTDAEVQAYYDAHKADYKTKETRQLHYVLFPLRMTAADTQAAADIIQRAHAQLSAGEEFNLTMLDFSDHDPDTMSRMVARTTLDAKTDSIVAKLKPGSFSAPFLSGQGWQVVRLDSARKESVALRRITVRVKGSGEVLGTLRDSAGGFTDKALAGNFDTVAAGYGLAVMRFRPMVGGELNLGSMNLSGSSQLVDWAKTAKAGATFPKTLRGPQGFMVFSLSEVQPAGFQPFDKVKPAASWKVRQEKEKAVWLARANDAMQQIRAGKTLEQYAAEDTGVEIVTEEYKGSADAARRKGAQFGGVVAALAAGDKYGLLETDWGAFILRCDERALVQPPVLTAEAWVQQRREQVGQSLMQTMLKEENVKDFREPSGD